MRDHREGDQHGQHHHERGRDPARGRRSGRQGTAVTVRWHLQQLGVTAPDEYTLARIFTARGMDIAQPQKRPAQPYRRFEIATVHECWQLDAFEWP